MAFLRSASLPAAKSLSTTQPSLEVLWRKRLPLVPAPPRLLPHGCPSSACLDLLRQRHTRSGLSELSVIHVLKTCSRHIKPGVSKPSAVHVLKTVQFWCTAVTLRRCWAAGGTRIIWIGRLPTPSIGNSAGRALGKDGGLASRTSRLPSVCFRLGPEGKVQVGIIPQGATALCVSEGVGWSNQNLPSRAYRLRS